MINTTFKKLLITGILWLSILIPVLLARNIVPVNPHESLLGTMEKPFAGANIDTMKVDRVECRILACDEIEGAAPFGINVEFGENFSVTTNNGIIDLVLSTVIVGIGGEEIENTISTDMSQSPTVSTNITLKSTVVDKIVAFAQTDEYPFDKTVDFSIDNIRADPLNKSIDREVLRLGVSRFRANIPSNTLETIEIENPQFGDRDLVYIEDINDPNINEFNRIKRTLTPGMHVDFLDITLMSANPYSSIEKLFYDEENKMLYIGMGYWYGDGDLFQYNVETGEYILIRDSDTRAVTAIYKFDNKIYFGYGSGYYPWITAHYGVTSQGGKIYSYDLSTGEVLLSYNGAYEAVTSFAELNGELYAGTGGDGNNEGKLIKQLSDGSWRTMAHALSSGHDEVISDIISFDNKIFFSAGGSYVNTVLGSSIFSFDGTNIVTEWLYADQCVGGNLMTAVKNFFIFDGDLYVFVFARDGRTYLYKYNPASVNDFPFDYMNWSTSWDSLRSATVYNDEVYIQFWQTSHIYIFSKINNGILHYVRSFDPSTQAYGGQSVVMGDTFYYGAHNKLKYYTTTGITQFELPLANNYPSNSYLSTCNEIEGFISQTNLTVTFDSYSDPQNYKIILKILQLK